MFKWEPINFKHRINYIFNMSDIQEIGGQFSLMQNINTITETEMEFVMDENFQNKYKRKS